MRQNNDYRGVIVGGVLIIIILAILFWTAWEQSLRNSSDLSDGATAISTRDTGTNFPITNTTSSTSGMSQNDVAFRVQMSTLSSEQQALLRTAGISGSEIEITNEMKTCAEQSIGASRTAEIVGGSRPTLIESGKLIVCYNG